MITVWNTPIAASVEQILRDLKLMLFAEGLLRDQNNTGSDVMVTCPFHKGGHERKPSCGVSLKEKITPDKTYEAGTVHCYTCGYTADLPTFISDLLGMDRIADRVGANINTSKYNAMRVARTETKRVTYSSQAAAFEDQNVGEVRYMAANNGGDSRTCDLCREDHGKVYKLGEEPSLPRHPNCRCWYIPVVKDTFEDNELNELTGSVRGAENYEKWKEKEAAKIKAAQEAKQSEEIIKAKVTADTAKADLEKTEVKLTDYPEAFYSKKTEAKNTQALLDYVNAQNVTDPNILKLYKSMDKLCEGLSDDIVIKVSHRAHRVKSSWTKTYDLCIDVGIPKVDPKFIGTYDTNLHEEMHFLDMLLTTKQDKHRYPKGMFSQSYKPLIEAFDKATPKIGDRAKTLFSELTKYYETEKKKMREKYDTMIVELDKQYSAGKIDAKKFNSMAKKLWTDIVEENDKKLRGFKGGGISGLQDIYDAMYPCEKQEKFENTGI